jgi:hypothetical protein
MGFISVMTVASREICINTQHITHFVVMPDSGGLHTLIHLVGGETVISIDDITCLKEEILDSVGTSKIRRRMALNIVE